MIKVLLAIALALLIALTAAYVLIPSTIVFSKVIALKATVGGTERAFNTTSERSKWWPEKSADSINEAGRSLHTFDNYQYEFPAYTFSGSSVWISHGDKKISSNLHFVPLLKDSVAVKWKAELPATKNPFKKIANYVEAVAIKKNMTEILETVKSFLNKEENLYGIKITEEKVMDTILISRKWASNTYPSTDMIYEKVDGLKAYILKYNAAETNHPMLNVFEDNGIYKNMVAIPVNKELPEADSFVVKKMVSGKILTTEVRGGPSVPKATMKKIEFYIDDHKKTSPAIPFESLVTDRRQEKDSTKWITKVYYPVY